MARGEAKFEVARRMVLLVAERGKLRVSDMDEAGSSREQRSQIAHALRKAGVFRSFRGRYGGFDLAGKIRAHGLTAIDLARAVDYTPTGGPWLRGEVTARMREMFIVPTP